MLDRITKLTLGGVWCRDNNVHVLAHSVPQSMRSWTNNNACVPAPEVP